MLEYNPYFRPTAKQLLKLPIFDKIRIKSIETSSPFKILVNADKDKLKQRFGKESLLTPGIDNSNELLKLIVLESVKVKQ